jgi:hypothetical protein
MAAVWAAAALKVAASVVPLPAVRDSDNRTPLVRVLAWIAAVILTVYGALLTTVGLLVQADVIHQSASADHRALAWHAYLWDPWFLIWGVLIASALVCSRNRQASTAGARNRGGDVRQASTSAYDDIAHARSAN